MKKLAPILVCGIPAMLFVLIAYRGFLIGEKGLAVVTMAFAVICVLGCWLVIREVNRKEKELAEKKRMQKE